MPDKRPSARTLPGTGKVPVRQEVTALAIGANKKSAVLLLHALKKAARFPPPGQQDGAIGEKRGLEKLRRGGVGDVSGLGDGEKDDPGAQRPA